MHPVPVPQFPFSAASGNLTVLPVSSLEAFLKVFSCSDSWFIVPQLLSSLAQIVLGGFLCSSLPTLSISLYASLLRSYTANTVNSK